MNKLILAMMAMFVIMVGAVSAVSLPGITTISGHIYESDMTTPVAGADVTVTCNSIEKTTVSSATGSYAVVYLVSECAPGDTVLVEAEKETASGSNDGKVSSQGSCLVNTGIVDVSIPEFGVIAGGIALIGALGIFMYRRNN